jgi:hypothetical protein
LTGPRRTTKVKTNIMGEDDREMRITLLEIMDKLPPEAQKWVNGMNRDEKFGTEIILNNAGVDYFIRYWRDHKDDLDEIRNF